MHPPIVVARLRATALLFVLLATPVAHAGRFAKWPNGTQVAILLNPGSWPASDQLNVRRQILNAAGIWNSVGGANIYLYYNGDTSTVPSCSLSNTLNVVTRAQCAYAPCGAWAETCYAVNGSNVILSFIITYYSANGATITII